MAFQQDASMNANIHTRLIKGKASIIVLIFEIEKFQYVLLIIHAYDEVWGNE